MVAAAAARTYATRDRLKHLVFIDVLTCTAMCSSRTMTSSSNGRASIDYVLSNVPAVV